MAPLASEKDNRKRRRYETLNDTFEDDDALVSIARKRVRFELPCRSSTASTAATFGDTIAKQVHESEIHYEDLDKEELWWSKGERAEIAECTRKLARGFKRQGTDRVNHYLHVFEECSKSPSPASSNFIESVSLGVPTEVRGLECGFVPSVKAYRKKHLQEVLDTQAQLHKGKMRDAMRLRVLAARAMRSSRPSRIMARLMGEADADTRSTFTHSSGDVS